jgi:hypothetical protein
VTGSAEISEAWTAQLDALVRATSREGLPWSCPGGTVELVVNGSGAVLTVTDAHGVRVSRAVADPGELVPTGEALLAAPMREPEVAPAKLPDVPEVPSVVPAAPAAPASPRARIEVALGPRVSAPLAMAWGSAQGHIEIPFGRWSVGFWARYDLHLAGPSGNWPGFRASAVSAGIDAGRQIILEPFELRATLGPSAAIVIMEAGSEDAVHPEGQKLALRLGGALRGTFPLRGVFRGVVAIDGEIAPEGIGNIDTDNKPPQLPPVPAYTAGLLLGVEATIR